jgi:threonine/homoserine/homoserine lactone efflux protein
LRGAAYRAGVTPTFLLTSLVIVATPGTGALITIAAGLAHGRRQSLVAALGCTLGIVPHLVAAITGLAALVHANAVAFSTIKWLGVAYLLWMAWSTWRQHGALVVDDHARAPASTWRTIGSAVLANLLNPKLTIFFFAFLPQFVTPGRGELVEMVQLSAVFMVMTGVVFAAYGIGAAAVRDRVLARPRVMDWLRRTFAAAFVALGARLAVERA